MSVKAPPELEFRRNVSSLALSANAFGSVNRVSLGENARVWETLGEFLQKWNGRDSTHPLTPSAREGEDLDCFDSRCESRNDNSLETVNSKVVDEFLGLCEANE